MSRRNGGYRRDCTTVPAALDKTSRHCRAPDLDVLTFARRTRATPSGTDHRSFSVLLLPWRSDTQGSNKPVRQLGIPARAVDSSEPAALSARTSATDPGPSLLRSAATLQLRSTHRRSARHWPAAAVHPPCFPFPSRSGETILEARNDTQPARLRGPDALCTRYPQAPGPASHRLWTTGARPSTEKTRRALGTRARRRCRPSP